MAAHLRRDHCWCNALIPASLWLEQKFKMGRRLYSEWQPDFRECNCSMGRHWVSLSLQCPVFSDNLSTCNAFTFYHCLEEKWLAHSVAWAVLARLRHNRRPVPLREASILRQTSRFGDSFWASHQLRVEESQQFEHFEQFEHFDQLIILFIGLCCILSCSPY